MGNFVKFPIFIFNDSRLKAHKSFSSTVDTDIAKKSAKGKNAIVIILYNFIIYLQRHICCILKLRKVTKIHFHLRQKNFCLRQNRFQMQQKCFRMQQKCKKVLFLSAK